MYSATTPALICYPSTYPTKFSCTVHQHSYVTHLHTQLSSLVQYINTHTQLLYVCTHVLYTYRHMYVCIYVCTYVCTYVHTYVRECTVHTYVCMFTSTVCTHACLMFVHRWMLLACKPNLRVLHETVRNSSSSRRNR